LARTSHAVVAADERDLVALRLGPGHSVQIPIGSNVACAPPAGYDRAAFRARLRLADVGLLYFGLLNASKGLDSLLEALALILDRRPLARLLLLGGPTGASDRTDQQVARQVGARLAAFGERIVQPGFLSPRELSAYLLAGDVAVLPYTDGASPRRGSLLACAAHGLPIVSTRPVSQAVAEAVLPVAPDDAAALAAAALRVVDDVALQARLRAGSRALAERTSWSRIAAAHLALYRRLLAR
jgi:glycosyltransferase involved in cell wall biosynthesis